MGQERHFVHTERVQRRTKNDLFNTKLFNTSRWRNPTRYLVRLTHGLTNQDELLVRSVMSAYHVSPGDVAVALDPNQVHSRSTFSLFFKVETKARKKDLEWDLCILTSSGQSFYSFV